MMIHQVIIELTRQTNKHHSWKEHIEEGLKKRLLYLQHVGLYYNIVLIL
jgi:hypothetical protein